jgi:protein involved in polysaccharide export with SLBB domain
MQSTRYTSFYNFFFFSIQITFFALTTLVLSAPLSKAKDYTLGTGDILQITILERPSLNGAYTIGPDGKVSVPSLGAINARGETSRSFEKKLLGLAKEKIAEPSLAIQIVQYRPFFILGDVKEAGQHAYVPGISVMQAVALANGFGRQKDNSDTLSRTLANLRAQQSFDQNVVELVSSRARLARLLAEQSGAETFEYQVTDNFGLGDSLLKDILAKEQRVFLERVTSHAKNLELSKLTLEARRKESVSYLDRIASQNDFLDSVADELSKTKELREQGLVSASKLNDLVRKEISTRGEVLQTRSLLRQSEASVRRSEQEVYAIDAGRKLQLASDIQTLTESISKLEARIDGDVSILSETGGGRISSSTKSGHVYELYRNGVLQSTDVTLKTPVEPGDTLFVIKERLPGSLN